MEAAQWVSSAGSSLQIDWAAVAPVAQARVLMHSWAVWAEAMVSWAALKDVSNRNRAWMSTCCFGHNSGGPYSHTSKRHLGHSHGGDGLI